MAFATYWTRASFRRSWRALGAIALLIALIGGLSLFSIAGARRTQSAYPRFLRSTDPSTMVVDVGSIRSGGHETLDAIAQLPQVEQAKAYAAFYVAPWVNGEPDFTQNFEALGSLDGRFFDQDRFTPIEGRLPDPNRADEVAVNEESARLYGYQVGQQIDFGTVSADDVENPSSDDQATQLQPRLLTHSTIVGIGAFIEEVMQDDTDRSPLVLFTPAYVNQAKGLETYAWQGVVLRNGDADISAVTQTINEQTGGIQIIRVVSTDTFHAEQAIRPVSLALAVFGIIAGLACLVLTAQALSRHVRDERHVIARALGAGSFDIGAATALGPAIAVVVGALLAVAIAVLMSPAMPVGKVRRIEVAPGFNTDWTVLGLGALFLIVSLFVVMGMFVRREAPRHVKRRADARRAHGRGRHLSSTKLPPTAAMGLGFAGVSASHSTVAPGRSVMASASIAIAALVAAVTFGSSMQHLVANPELFGWNWDVALVDGAGYGNTNPEGTKAVLGSDDDIETWSGAFYGAEDINGQNVPLLGMDPSSSATPPIGEGRMIAGPGEIVLGSETLTALNVRVGDTVQASTGALKVVGSATFPAIGQVHANHTSLGVGGLVVVEQVPGYDRNVAGADPSSSGPPADEYGPNVLFVRFRDGADKQAAIDRLEGEVDQVGDYNGVVVTPVQRAAEIVNADSIRGSSLLLGAAVALAALASLGVALTVAVRRHRRDLGLLKTLGFTRRQISITIAWQATITIVVGLVIGVPVGVVVGRLTWNLFAHQLDVVAEPVVPVTAIFLTGLAAIAAANALAALPARYARTVPAAVALNE